MNTSSATEISPSDILLHSRTNSLKQTLFDSDFICLASHSPAETNLLLSAASNLLAHIYRLRTHAPDVELQKLHDSLLQEIKIFETSTRHNGYTTELMLIARYILCATLDETIVTSPWISNLGDWQDLKLLTTFQNDQFGVDRFFLILDKLCEDPGFYIDSLELIYICLRLGFKGHYYFQENGYDQLITITDKLYHCINTYRGEPPFHLSPHASSDYQPLLTHASPPKRPQLIKTLLITLSVMLLVYLIYCSLIIIVSWPFYQSIANFASMHNSYSTLNLKGQVNE